MVRKKTVKTVDEVLFWPELSSKRTKDLQELAKLTEK